MTVLLIALGALVLLALGALFGSSLETRSVSTRNRRLAAMQRELNVQVRELEAAGLLDAGQAAQYVRYELAC